MLEALTPNQWLAILTATWSAFTVSLAWILARAKRYTPLTKEEARQLWHIHKRNTGCQGKRWRQVLNGSSAVGFECECGYIHTQKKPLGAHAPTPLASHPSALDTLQAPHKY